LSKRLQNKYKSSRFGFILKKFIPFSMSPVVKKAFSSLSNILKLSNRLKSFYKDNSCFVGTGIDSQSNAMKSEINTAKSRHT